MAEDLSDFSNDAENVRAKYSTVSESLRSSIPESRMCLMFCGGKNCKYENVEKWKNEQAIDGIYSTWITRNILAMSRPNTIAIETHKIIPQFKKANIKSIINLQMPGEHEFCGPGLESSGFSYEPQQFMDAGVLFYNYGWRDYGVGSIKNLVDVVQVMQFAISSGKVAIHCHAGLGRTGVLIACYLVYTNRVDPKDAIAYIRHKRPGSIQSSSQLKVIKDFNQFLLPMRVIFNLPTEPGPSFSLSQYISRQKFVVHGEEAKVLKYLPKIVYACCNRLLSMCGRYCGKEECIRRRSIVENKHSKSLLSSMKMNTSQSNQSFKSNQNGLNSNLSNTNLYKSQSYDFRDNISSDSLTTTNTSIDSDNNNINNIKFINIESYCPIPITSNYYRSMANIPLLDGSGGGGGSGGGSGGSSGGGGGVEDIVELNSIERTSNKLSVEKSATKNLKPNINANNKKVNYLKSSDVISSMAKTRYSDAVLKTVNDLKCYLNMDESGWTKLDCEVDADVISCLLWHWLDELKEPILTHQDIHYVLDDTLNVGEVLEQIGKPTSQTIFYLVYTLECLKESKQNKLSPTSVQMKLYDDAERTEHLNLIQRIISTITHQNCAIESKDLNKKLTKDHLMRTSNQSGSVMKLDLSKKLVEFISKLSEHIHHMGIMCYCYLKQNVASHQGSKNFRESPIMKRNNNVGRLTNRSLEDFDSSSYNRTSKSFTVDRKDNFHDRNQRIEVAMGATNKNSSSSGTLLSTRSINSKVNSFRGKDNEKVSNNKNYVEDVRNDDYFDRFKNKKGNGLDDDNDDDDNNYYHNEDNFKFNTKDKLSRNESKVKSLSPPDRKFNTNNNKSGLNNSAGVKAGRLKSIKNGGDDDDEYNDDGGDDDDYLRNYKMEDDLNNSYNGKVRPSGDYYSKKKVNFY